MKARVGHDDADVGQCRLGEHASDVAHGQRRFERGEVVERHDDRGGRGVEGGPDVARPLHGATIGVEGGQCLVDRAVIAPVEDQHLGSAGEMAGEPQHETVGVGGGHRHLPDRQAEPPAQLGADPRRIDRWQHRGDAPTGLGVERVGDLGEAVACHRAGVAEAEVDVVEAVRVGEVGAMGSVEEDGERAWPAGHPGHGNAAQQVGLGLFGQHCRAWMGGDEALFLSGVPGS